uniref:Uncharacterized protein n=1 Tax=Pundamilia nyererei TaxID=303518 RepID=A0A3B4HBX4_9CICH
MILFLKGNCPLKLITGCATFGSKNCNQMFLITNNMSLSHHFGGTGGFLNKTQIYSQMSITLPPKHKQVTICAVFYTTCQNIILNEGPFSPNVEKHRAIRMLPKSGEIFLKTI